MSNANADFLTMNKDVQVVIDAIDETTCRHCANERTDPDPPTLCTECGRCIDDDGCGDSPNCTIRDPEYTGNECRDTITPLPVVSQTHPPDDGATDVAVGTGLTVTFTRPMKAASISTSTCKLLKADGTSTGKTFTAPTVLNVDGAGCLVTLHCTTDLDAATAYKFRCTVSCQDSVGQAMEEEYDSDLGFTTAA